MRIRPQSIAGGVLTVTLVSTTLMGVALASYLGLVKSQNLSTMRSQQWNLALPIAEAGIEEALVHLADVSTNNRAVNGWILDAAEGVVTKERWLASNKYIVKITTNEHPTITAEGYAVNLDGVGLMSTPRIVRVTTTNDALFAKGMVAKGMIDLKGNNIKTDSFDSSNTNYSTGGLYDFAKRRDKGDVATNSGLTNSLNVGNAEIFGKAATGPGGSVTVGNNGGVGSKAWHDAGNEGLQSGYVTDDMNVAFPDVKAPFSGGASSVVSGAVGGTNYTYALSGGNYQMASLSLSGNEEMIVTSNTVLYVTGNVSISGNARIIIQPNASLQMYVAGADTSLGGNGVSNQNGNAMKFQYFGLPSNTSVSFGGNTSFTGLLYAPSADFHLGGGGSDTYDFVGASITGSVHMNGHFKFHYDEALGPWGPRRGYVVTSWNEM